MSSLSAKDRVSLCQFTFADGRRCRTPRTGKNPHFCFDHAQKEARASSAESLGNDLDYFFSADFLSACDLSTALGRLIPAVIRGDVKPRTARTVAYLAQTLLQTIHLAKHEYINTFGTDGWRKSIRNSVNSNYNHRFPPAPEPDQPQSPQPAATLASCHSERSDERPASAASPESYREEPAISHPTAPSPTSSPAPSPQTPLPPTGAEFAQQVLARHSLLRSAPVGQTGPLPATPHIQPEPPDPAATPNAQSAPPRSPAPTSPSTPPKGTPSSPSAPPLTTGANSPAPPQPQAQPPVSQPDDPPQPRPSARPYEPNRDAPWRDFSRTIPHDSHLL